MRGVTKVQRQVDKLEILGCGRIYLNSLEIRAKFKVCEVLNCSAMLE